MTTPTRQRYHEPPAGAKYRPPCSPGAAAYAATPVAMIPPGDHRKIVWAAIIVTVLVALFGLLACSDISVGEQPASAMPQNDPLPRAPSPRSASEGVDLQIELDAARAHLAIVAQKAAQATGALGIIGWASAAAFAAVLPAWFLGGFRTAAKVALFGLALAFAPTIIGELWSDVRPLLRPLAALAGIGMLAYYAGQWLKQRRINRQTNEQAANLRAAVAADTYLGQQGNPATFTDAERTVMLSQAALLDHVGTAGYDPAITRLPKVAVEGFDV